MHQVVQAQTALDDEVRNLIDEMDKSCKIAVEADPLRKRSSRFNEILEKLLAQVSECAYFVTDYCRDKSFGTYSGSRCRYLHLTDYSALMTFLAGRASKYLISGVKAQVDDYISNLKELCDNLDKVSSVSCSVAVYRVLDDIGTIKEGLDSLRELILDPHDVVPKFIEHIFL